MKLKTILRKIVLVGMFIAASQQTIKITAKQSRNIVLNESMIMCEWSEEILREKNEIRSFTEEEKETLLHIMMSEAGTEGPQGKLFVALVILNRKESDLFPGTIKEVVFQQEGGIYQFSPVQDGTYWTVEPDKECYDVLEELQYSYTGNINGALYFCETNHDKWHETKEFLFSYKNHKFYR